MNMPMNKRHQTQQYLSGLMTQAPLTETNQNNDDQTHLPDALHFLDRTFPLTQGSHKDVSSYVVYYQHLLAFFNDGSQASLRQPQQFVAFNGSKNAPSAIVLKDNNSHVELTLADNGVSNNNQMPACIDLIVEKPLGVILSTDDNHSDRNWVNLYHPHNNSYSNTPNNLFTAKDGSNYELKTLKMA